MLEPVKLCIVLDGGLVQSVISAGVPLEVVVIDYDTEGADPSELRNVPQDNGSEEPAFVSNWGIIRPTASEMAFAARAFEIDHDPAGEGAPPARFRNSYACPACGTAWQDESAHTCDDRCPDCNTSCSPSESADILPGNAPCSASGQIQHHDEVKASIASEATPEPENEGTTEPATGLWRARLETPNFTFEAFGRDMASARRALGQGLIRHAQQYGLDPDWWRGRGFVPKITYVRGSAAYRDGELLRGSEDINP